MADFKNLKDKSAEELLALLDNAAERLRKEPLVHEEMQRAVEHLNLLAKMAREAGVEEGHLHPAKGLFCCQAIHVAYLVHTLMGSRPEQGAATELLKRYALDEQSMPFVLTLILIWSKLESTMTAMPLFLPTMQLAVSKQD